MAADWSVYMLLSVFFMFAAMGGFCVGYFLMPGASSAGTNVVNHKKELSEKCDFLHHQQMETLGYLTAGIAHDFNNVLSIIAGYAMLLQKTPDHDKADEYIQSVINMTEKGAVLTRQLLIFGRKQEKDGDNAVRCNIIEAVNRQMVMVRPLLGENIDVEFRHEEDELYITASEHSVWTILMNIATNARDAMDGKGSFVIEISRNKKNDVCLTMTDTGKGIDRENLKKLFDPFFTTKKSGDGTGLGLSLVYGLVTQSGGHVDVKSTVGKGTSVIVSLPADNSIVREERDIKKIADGSEEVEIASLDGKTILVVDDEPQLTMVLKSMLSQTGMKVLYANSGNEALAMQDVYGGKIDFLLSDMVMPGMNGDKLIRLFAEMRPETKLMLMSGYPKKSDSYEMNIPDDIPLMFKPFTVEELQEKLKNLHHSPPKKASDEKEYPRRRVAGYGMIN